MVVLLRNIFFSLALCVCTSTGAAVPSPTVNIGYATYQGVLFQDVQTNKTNTNFLGIRYAAPPTGSSRFRAARSPAFTPGIQLANTQPAACFAAGDGTAPRTPFNDTSTGTTIRRSTTDLAPTEDCLFLNVFVPGLLNSSKKLPVIFWIHGGGYVLGSASEYVGNDIIRKAGGEVILVVIQYRLGLFGFLPGQKVKNDGVLNAGLLDQQFALQWVQEHISKFGGDPAKVTVWGESAGAGSAMQHVVANGGRTNPPLFRAVITSSTFMPSQYQYNDPIPELIYREVVSQTNCTSARDTLNCLRAADVNTLQAANLEINASGFFGTFVFVPVVDGTFITQRPTELLRQQKVNVKTVLSITNSHEGTIFVDQSTANTVKPSAYVSQLFPALDVASAAAAAAQYAGLGTSMDQVNAIMSESIFVCPTYVFMRAFGQNAFKGEFALAPGFHGQDVGFYFPSFNGQPSYTNPDFDKAFSGSFFNFAVSLDPNVKLQSSITPLWRPWAGSSEMLFNKTAVNAPNVVSMQTTTSLMQRCSFWESVAAQIGQ